MNTVEEVDAASSTMEHLRAEALFASPLQRSDNPTLAQVRAAVAATLSHYGPRECATALAQEYGDHPIEAAIRMTWALAQVASAFGSTIHYGQTARSSRAVAVNQRVMPDWTAKTTS
jgi:hypothetical protein